MSNDWAWNSRRATKMHKALSVGKEKIRLAHSMKSTQEKADEIAERKRKRMKVVRPEPEYDFVGDFKQMIERQQQKAKEAVASLDREERWRNEAAEREERYAIELSVMDTKKQMELLDYKLKMLIATGL
jgi:ABC-type nitrate/sulfonate/bicarbonate transport system substrate-binding protein